VVALFHMIDLLVATTNQGKFAEVKAFLNGLPLRIVSLRDLLNPPVVVEDGVTFEENALKKARTLAGYSRKMTLADDSGIEVDALGGAPGIYSARYSGREGDDEANNRKLLGELAQVSDERRTARFVCALALCAPVGDGWKEWTVRESCEGRIAFAPSGANGFGYDPLFFYPPLGRTFGEIGRETKAGVSHRGKALKRLAELLPALIESMGNGAQQP
jgi:XTP/dITP diphosphohydrolase